MILSLRAPMRCESQADRCSVQLMTSAYSVQSQVGSGTRPGMKDWASQSSCLLPALADHCRASACQSFPFLLSGLSQAWYVGHAGSRLLFVFARWGGGLSVSPSCLVTIVRNLLRIEQRKLWQRAAAVLYGVGWRIEPRCFQQRDLLLLADKWPFICPS